MTPEEILLQRTRSNFNTQFRGKIAMTEKTTCLHDWRYLMLGSVRLCKKCNVRQIRREISIEHVPFDSSFGLSDEPLTQEQKELLIR